MFVTQADVVRFRLRCELVMRRGLSKALLIEGLQAGPDWLDKFEALTDDQLREVSALAAAQP